MSSSIEQYRRTPSLTLITGMLNTPPFFWTLGSHFFGVNGGRSYYRFHAGPAHRGALVRRSEGNGWNIGAAVRFLLSEQAPYITGQILSVDGSATLVGPSRASQ
jgi:NAD(P)-dependent dehydrogenase (short-subunit alcohol dehydrogenase family)